MPYRRDENALELHDEIADLETMIGAIVDALAPELVARNSLGYESAAPLLLAAGDNSERINSEARFAALDSAHQEPVSDTVSTYYVGHEIAATFLALLSLTDAEDWRFLARLSPTEFAQWLRKVALRIDPRKYRKHSRGPKKPRQKVPYDPKHPHVSTQRLLLERKPKAP